MVSRENARRPATAAPRVEVPEGTPRPLALLSEYARRYPRARKVAESLREGRRTGAIPDWPGWCYLPLGVVHAIVQGEGREDSPGQDRDLDALVMGALIPWRVTKGIYRFDPDVLGSLWDTPLTGNIPTGVLKHLPEWCCYVDLASSFRPGTQPDPWRTTMGFFVFLSWDTKQNRPELWIVLDTEEGLIPFFLNLRASTVEDCWLSTQKETLLSSGMPVEEVESLLSGEETRLAASYVTSRIAPFLNTALYLCSADPGGSKSR